MKGDDIAERLLNFAVQTLAIVDELPNTLIGKHVARQLTRSSTSGGANYEEARAAESRGDFAHKIGIAAKEVGESVYWLRVVERAKLHSSSHAAREIVNEGNQLVAILKSSARTAKRHLSQLS